MFATEQAPFGKATGVQHVILLTIDVPYRRIPPNYLNEVKSHIKELYRNGDRNGTEERQ